MLYPQNAIDYLRRELDGSYDTRADLHRPTLFPYGLPASVYRADCERTLDVMMDFTQGGVSGLLDGSNLF